MSGIGCESMRGEGALVHECQSVKIISGKTNFLKIQDLCQNKVHQTKTNKLLEELPNLLKISPKHDTKIEKCPKNCITAHQKAN